ncbi:putative mediator of RNA polymerase II transcription subunit 26c [Hordeum vulgare]|nr:putative mediator of RNA polymerase II transcription subunit 26c [Hordeum vulgare]
MLHPVLPTSPSIPKSITDSQEIRSSPKSHRHGRADASPVEHILRRLRRRDDAIEAVDPGQFSRHVFRRARGDLLGRLCSADDDDEAERLCGILDDVMAESLETLRLVPEAPISKELAEAVRALREHDSERVRLLARGIVSGWEASVQDDIAEVPPATPMNKLENVAKVTPAMPIKKLPQSKAAVGQHQDISVNPNAETKRPPKKASDPAAGFVDGDRAVLSWEDKMEAAKRKLRQGYQEAEDAKRRRRTQLVQAPKMMQPASQMQPIRRCTSSMAKKTISIRTQLH